MFSLFRKKAVTVDDLLKNQEVRELLYKFNETRLPTCRHIIIIPIDYDGRYTYLCNPSLEHGPKSTVLANVAHDVLHEF